MSYITKDDYLNFSGIDLEIEFKNGNYDVDNSYKIFIERVEETALEILKYRYENHNINTKIENNLTQFKRGMLWQINYILNNSELYLNNEENQTTNELKYLSPNALMIWKNIGLCNPITQR